MRRASRRSGGKSSPPRFPLRRWWHSNRAVIRFLAVFSLVFGLLYAASLTAIAQRHFWPWNLGMNADVVGALLRMLGEDVVVAGTTLSGAVSLSIRRGCDVVECSELLVAAVIAFPAAARSRILGIGVALVLLQAINFVRLLVLYYVGKHAPGAFEWIHVEVLQVAMVLITLLLWSMWAARVTGGKQA